MTRAPTERQPPSTEPAGARPRPFPERAPGAAARWWARGAEWSGRDRFVSLSLLPFLLTPIPYWLTFFIAHALGAPDATATRPLVAFSMPLVVMTMTSVGLVPLAVVAWMALAPVWHLSGT